MGSRFDSVQSLPPLKCLHETACAVMDQSTEGNEIIIYKTTRQNNCNTEGNNLFGITQMLVS